MKSKVIIIAMVSMISGFILGSCGNAVIADQLDSLKIFKENENRMCSTWYVRDDDTGVNYVVVTTSRKNTDYSVCITPRLNADGSLYITD